MAKDRLSGKLAVILYSDVAGSTRSKHQDEQQTHGCITYNRYILSWFLLTFLICVFFTTTLFASPDYWPTKGWRSSSPEDQGMDSGKLIEMLEKVRDEKYPVDSITIIRNGYLVTDAYLYPHKKHTRHSIYSVTKSFTSALVGIALDKEYIKSVRQPLLEFFPEKTIANLNEQKKEITLEHLLTMSSGLDTRDSWVHNRVRLGMMQASDDWAQYVLDLPMARKPGKHFDYSNGGSYLLSAILQKTTGMSPLEFAKIHLFGPLGITDVTWPTGPQGINRGDDKMRLVPLDIAKFGLLYLNNGRWEDKQIVSKAWVEDSTRTHIHAPDTGFDGYGYQCWVPSANGNPLNIIWL
jgi:CubicO group peptidase (beta-lactamase class C family)